jgi:uncharacterized coiled-coil protein SlyX
MTEPTKTTETRIQELQEALGYIEHHNETLSSEIAQLNRTVAQLARRYAMLEARLSEINNRVVDQDPGNVPPPHSAGPDIPKDPL